MISHDNYVAYCSLIQKAKKGPGSCRIPGPGFGAWRFPTFARQAAALSSAPGGFTSGFGMGPGGARPLWSPSKLASGGAKAQGAAVLPPCLPSPRFLLPRPCGPGLPTLSEGRRPWALPAVLSQPRALGLAPLHGNLYRARAAVATTPGRASSRLKRPEACGQSARPCLPVSPLGVIGSSRTGN